MKVLGGLVATLVFLAAGCTDPTAPLEQMRLQTDQRRYDVGTSAVVELENTTRFDAFFHFCGNRLGGALEQKVEGRWREVSGFGTRCQAVYDSGITVILPGSSHVAEVKFDRAGEFRLRYDTGRSSRTIGTQSVRTLPFMVE